MFRLRPVGFELLETNLANGKLLARTNRDGGYIGPEMADALTHRGLAVTLIGRSETVLPTVDPHFGHMIEAELRRHDVKSDIEVKRLRC